MRASLAVGLVLAAACSPARSDGHATATPRSTASVSLPQPVVEPDAGSSETPEPAPAAPETSVDAASDAGAFAFALGDAGRSALSPPVTVVFATIDRQAKDGLFGEELVLFDRKVSCKDTKLPDHPARLYAMSLSWTFPQRSESTSFSIKNGVSTMYKARVEVVSAPTRVGAIGKIRLASGAEYNVIGGEVPVLVCR